MSASRRRVVNDKNGPRKGQTVSNLFQQQSRNRSTFEVTPIPSSAILVQYISLGDDGCDGVVLHYPETGLS